MNEPTKKTATIPSAMLEAATNAAFKAIWNSAMENPNIDGLPDEDCQTFAEVALEAAGVPALLERAATAEKEADKVREVLHEQAVYFEKEIAKQRGRIANLEGCLDQNAPVSSREKFIEELRNQIDEKDAQIADYEAAYRKVMAEQCASDERHCTCVPALRQRIAELEAEIARNQACIRLKLLPFEKEILEKHPEHQKTIDGWNDFLKRIAELETENAALRQKAQASAGGGE